MISNLNAFAVAEHKVHGVPEAAGEDAGDGDGVEEWARLVHHLQAPPHQVPGGAHLPHLTHNTATRGPSFRIALQPWILVSNNYGNKKVMNYFIPKQQLFIIYTNNKSILHGDLPAALHDHLLQEAGPHHRSAGKFKILAF